METPAFRECDYAAARGLLGELQSDFPHTSVSASTTDTGRRYISLSQDWDSPGGELSLTVEPALDGPGWEVWDNTQLQRLSAAETPEEAMDALTSSIVASRGTPDENLQAG